MEKQSQNEISIFDRMQELLDQEESFALVTVVKGPPVGKKMIVFPEQKPEIDFEGSLGNSDLDKWFLVTLEES